MTTTRTAPGANRPPGAKSHRAAAGKVAAKGAAKGHPVAQDTPVHRVNQTLQGPVADILERFHPEFRGLSRQRIYDRMLDDIDLLSRCFETFHRERKHFRYLIVDGRHRPVAEDDVPLSCGRSLNDVVAMVVRTAAKRYFRRTLDGVQESGRKPRPDSRAEELYEAIKDNLLHEWQVPLVPTYADMSPGLVRTLGARLLTIRRIEELRRLIDDPDAVDRLLDDLQKETALQDLAAAVPAIDLMSRLLTPDGQRLRPEAFNDALLSPDVRAQLPQADTVVRINDVLADVGGGPARLLITGLRLTVEQFTVMIFNARQVLGPAVFLRLFGRGGPPELVLKVIERGIASGLGPDSSLADCSFFVRRLFSRPLLVSSKKPAPADEAAAPSAAAPPPAENPAYALAP